MRQRYWRCVSWQVQQLKRQLLRKLAIQIHELTFEMFLVLPVMGDQSAVDLVLELLEDGRREVRDAGLKALETVGRPGDQDLISRLITMKEYSRKWAEKTGRPAWEIRETSVRAIGAIAGQHSRNVSFHLNLLREIHVAWTVENFCRFGLSGGYRVAQKIARRRAHRRSGMNRT